MGIQATRIGQWSAPMLSVHTISFMYQTVHVLLRIPLTLLLPSRMPNIPSQSIFYHVLCVEPTR